LDEYNLQLDGKYSEYLGRHKKKKFESFINSENKDLAKADALDLLKKMLIYDHVLHY